MDSIDKLEKLSGSKVRSFQFCYMRTCKFIFYILLYAMLLFASCCSLKAFRVMFIQELILWTRDSNILWTCICLRKIFKLYLQKNSYRHVVLFLLLNLLNIACILHYVAMNVRTLSFFSLAQYAGD